MKHDPAIAPHGGLGSKPDVEEFAEVLQAVTDDAKRYLLALDDRPILAADASEAAGHFGDAPLPQRGEGARQSIELLLQDGFGAASSSSGPRFFHFVTGGTTPAALAADWLASTLDQNALGWVASPLAARLESVSLSWLKQLFDLPPSWGGVLTTGATMANFVALASARHWWAERHGVDVEDEGLAGLPQIPIFTSGYAHSSAVKVVAMLGIGRSNIKVFAGDSVGRLDEKGLEAALRAMRGQPSLVVANAGEVNTGDFDPIDTMADLAEEHGAWLHVDGAFGLFARISTESAALAKGVERAHSVIGDGHKWLNVPYDCGFAFVHDPVLLSRTFGASAAYLMSPDDPRPNFMHLGPEMSRRARSIAAWATLHAYGRDGYRSMVDHHLQLAQRVAARVDAAPDLERLADVPLNIICFRFRPPGPSEDDLDGLNSRLGEAVLSDGRVYVGITVYDGHVAFRPAIVNWRTTASDVDLLVEVIRELGAVILSDSAA
ncbi:MAG: aminotransferase class V-fold PLP-dependent enzyme [Actinomycetota bacterium]|nr:aminotransferase class V-fold PLP-dependent enzyme [Actinomycetota bacterium]